MRSLGPLICVVTFIAAACAPQEAAESQVGAQTVRLTTQQQHTFVLDPPGPGYEPASSRSKGPHLKDPPLDREYMARQQQHLEVWKLREAEWRAQGLSEPDMRRLRSELKRSILGP
jgi:hypothetical protein